MTCPICGKSEFIRRDKSGQHRCDPKTLAAIDGAMKRDEPDYRKTEAHRLALGFYLLSLAGDW